MASENASIGENMKSRRSQQSGFTLVEIAIVLVIIGLLLGGILKGQELINSAKVKNLANDFRTIPTYIYAYQDKFKALPGDDVATANHLGATVCVAPCHSGNGNGVIQGLWSTNTATDESWQFWSHVRLANVAPGPTTWTTTADSDSYVPKNAVGGRIGISSLGAGQAQISGMSGSYIICSNGILGKFAKQLDTTMDDGDTSTGSMRAHLSTSTLGTAGDATIDATEESQAYIVCYSF
jgi:prepilin-type N-terminal cleavage/methylation domain-containing protein